MTKNVLFDVLGGLGPDPSGEGGVPPPGAGPRDLEGGGGYHPAGAFLK